MKPINLPLIAKISLCALCILVTGGFIEVYFIEAYREILRQKEGSTPVETITPQSWAKAAARAKNDKVYLRLGDRAGGGGRSSDNLLSIALLSPTLKNHPKAGHFIVSWSYTAAMGTDVFELTYHRKKGTSNFRSHWRGSPPQLQRFQGITDAMIHAAARKRDSFTNIEKYK